jgi:hypothetical protein
MNILIGFNLVYAEDSRCTMTATREPTPPPLRQLGGTATRQYSPPPAEHGSASCWLCGTHQPTSLMVADGGQACADVRWYCRDTQRCTWRWTGQSA